MLVKCESFNKSQQLLKEENEVLIILFSHYIKKYIILN